MLITGTVLAFAFTMASHVNSKASEKSVISSLNAVADIIAISSVSSLAFSDRDAAKNYLQLLKSHPSIVYACVRTIENIEFAQYSPDSVNVYTCDKYIGSRRIILATDFVDLYKPILLDGERIGSLQIKASLIELKNQTIESAKYSLLIYIGLMIPAVFITKRILGYIINPITRLKDVAQKVSTKKDYSLRMRKSSDDEVGVLIDSFNNMLDQIQSRDSALVEEKEKAESSADTTKKYALETEQTNKQLENEIREKTRVEFELSELNETLEEKVSERTFELKELNEKIGDIARSAGMAEVASGVLHNVGNVLNSVNVSASVIREKIRKSKLGNLNRVAKLLEDNKSNIADFISNNEAGKQVPKFLLLLADQLSVEKEEMYHELDQLVDNIDHIKNVISMQQSYAGSYGVREKIMLSDLVEDALRMNVQGMGRHGIKVERSYADIPLLYVDKHKVLQVMINLISNAKHSMIESKGEEKTLSIKISKQDAMAKLEIKDTGVGIAEEDVSHLFEYGFKKRRDGHGFGLHHSAIVANELGGKILAQSEGLGAGANFILWLPYEDGCYGNGNLGEGFSGETAEEVAR